MGVFRNSGPVGCPIGDCKVGDRAALIEIIHGLFRDSLFTKTQGYAADTLRCTMFRGSRLRHL